MSMEMKYKGSEASGRKSDASWWQLVGLIVCALISVYAIFPSESASERFSLFVRLGFLCVAAALTIVFGAARRELVTPFCAFAFFYIFVVAWSNAPYFTPRLINLIASILCAGLMIMGSVSGKANAFVLRVLNVLLIFSAGALFLQLGMYVLSGNIFEIHGLVFPWGASRSAELERFGIARLSGIHTEPGTHSVFTVGLIILRCLLGGRLFDRVAYIGMGSVLTTLSFWGVFATMLYFVLYCLSMIKSRASPRNVIYFCFFIITLVLIFYITAPKYLIEDIFKYFTLRAELGDGSGGAKVIAWDMGLKRIGEVVFFGLPVGSDYCNGCISPQDAGLLLNFSMFFGLTSAILFFGIFFYGSFKCGGYALAIFSGLFLVAKFYYFDPIVWLIFFSSAVWCLRRKIWR